MSSAVSTGPYQNGHRWAAAVLASLLLAGVAAMGTTTTAAARASSVTPSQAADPPPARAAAVEAGLGIKAVPAEIVFLIDLSDSMSQDGLYPHVQQDLPAYLETLAQQEPQDQVVVITFGRPGTAQVVYVGRPTPDIGLPPVANEGSTDFGQAFALAIDQLSQPPAGTRVGGVVLMSDGELHAPTDRQYDTYQAPGWQALRARVKGLPIAVTGYSLPLTTNSAYIADQRMALSTVFSSLQTLPSGTVDLTAALSAAGQDVLDREVAAAAAPDSGRGVRITWSGLPGSGAPLDLRSPGHLDVRVTITAITQRVPLYLTGLGVASPGLSFTVSGQLPPELMLAPGRSVTVPVHLTWQRVTSGHSLRGGSRTVSGQLVLTGAVDSTYAPTLVSAFADTSFSVGGLNGNRSGKFTAVVATTGVLVIVVIFLVVLAALVCVALFSIRLRGTLILTDVDYRSRTLRLGPWPRTSARTADLIGIPGRITVRRSLFSRKMRLKLWLAGKPSGDVELKPGGRTMAVGIDIRHTRKR
jgi:von Willebrand factor type A domain